MNEHAWTDKVPKVLLTWAFAWLVVFALVGRYMVTGETPPGELLLFASTLIVTAAGLQVGMRGTTKADVIRAETEAKIVEKGTTGERPAAAIRPALAAYAGTHPRDRMSEDGP